MVTFSRFDRIPTCDAWRDEQTESHSIHRASTALHGKMGHVTLTTPLWGNLSCVDWHLTALSVTKSELLIFTLADDKKATRKFEVVWVLRAHSRWLEMTPFDRQYTTSLPILYHFWDTEIYWSKITDFWYRKYIWRHHCGCPRCRPTLILSAYLKHA